LAAFFHCSIVANFKGSDFKLFKGSDFKLKETAPARVALAEAA